MRTRRDMWTDRWGKVPEGTTTVHGRARQMSGARRVR